MNLKVVERGIREVLWQGVGGGLSKLKCCANAFAMLLASVKTFSLVLLTLTGVRLNLPSTELSWSHVDLGCLEMSLQAVK